MGFLVDSGFRVEDIAIMFSCSKGTIERCLHQYQLSTRNYSTLNNVELDLLVGQISSSFPRCGEKNGIWQAKNARQKRTKKESKGSTTPS